MTLPPESGPTFPGIKRKTEDNEVEVVKNSGIKTKIYGYQAVIIQLNGKEITFHKSHYLAT